MEGESKIRRSRSPVVENRLVSLVINKEIVGVDEDSEIYRSAINKLVDAASKYDRERCGEFIKVLENRQLDKDFFRTILATGLNCKLTRDELDSFMPIVSNGGFIDGCEFVCMFYRLRFESRSKFLSERMALENQKKQAAEEMAKKKKERLDAKTRIRLTCSYTKQDFESAMDKLAEAAFRYDRLMPGSLRLDAFECEKMRPELFREQLRRAFNVHLTIKELDALFDFLVKDEEGESVMCANFLVQFFRLGFQERTRRLKERWAEKKKAEEAREKKKIEELEEIERRNAEKCTYVFSAEEKERALMKLRDAARLYDKTTPGAMSMKAFEVASMPPHVFKEQLRRIFNLRLTPAELGALMTIFDTDGDGDVTCEEFSKTFLAMGFAERERELKAKFLRQKESEKAAKAEQQRKEDEIAAENAKKYTYDFSESDYQSALAKIEKAAWKYDKNMPGAPSLVAFDKLTMAPHDFKEQLRRAFSIQLSPPELGALLTYFNASEDGTITCSHFLISFFKLGFQERQRRRAQWLAYEESRERARRKEEEDKKVEAEKKLTVRVDSFTEEEFQSAFSKLTTAAIRYEKNSYGARVLAAFEAESMEPHVFREQMKIALNVRLSVGELGALMSYFDRSGSGRISCKDFLVEFYRTGVEERDRIRSSWRTEQKQREEKVAQEQEKLEKDAMLRAMREVNYEFTESDFDDALDKLIRLCRTFDHVKQLGPAGFSSFSVDKLTPSEFREMLKRSFSLRLTPAQLGALVTFFDPSTKGTVSCDNFIHTFVKIRVKCLAFEGRPEEAQLVAEYKNELKEGYKRKVQQLLDRTANEELRPWRVNRTKRPGHRKVHHAHPLTAIDKLKLRMRVGRRRGVLDLSSKACWPNSDEDGDSDGSVSMYSQVTGTSSKARRRKSTQDASRAAEDESRRQVVVPAGEPNNPSLTTEDIVTATQVDTMPTDLPVVGEVPTDGDKAPQNEPIAEEPPEAKVVVIDATDEDRKANAAIAVKTAAAVGRLTLASAFVQGEAVVRKIIATNLPFLNDIKSTGGKQNPFVRLSLKSTGERAFTPVLVNPGPDCTWDLLDLYLGGAFIAAKRLQRFGMKAARKQSSSISMTSLGSLDTFVDDASEQVLEVEVLSDSVVVSDTLIGIASAPLPNLPIAAIGASSRPSSPSEHGESSQAIGMAQWRLELSLDLQSSLEDNALPAGSLALEVEVPAASDNIPDSVVSIPAGIITIKKINVYDLELLSDTEGKVSKDSPPSYIVLSIGDEWRAETDVKRGKLLVFDVERSNMVSPVLTNKAFLHRRLNVALMHKRDSGETGSPRDILVSHGSMSLRGAAYQQGLVSSLSLLLKDPLGNPVSRVSINVQVDATQHPNKSLGNDNLTEVSPISAGAEGSVTHVIKKAGIPSSPTLTIKEDNSEKAVAKRRRQSLDSTKALQKALEARAKSGPNVNFRLRAIPEEIFKMTHLRELWLSDNLLTNIPPEIGDLRQLKVLSVSGNRLERLPPEICLLDQLERFYAADNNLESLPDLFFKLRKLQELDLSMNGFTAIPDQVLALSQLLHLNMSDNLLTDLPEGLIRLRCLVTLDVRFNRFCGASPAVLGRMCWVQVVGVMLPAPVEVAVSVYPSEKLPNPLAKLLGTENEPSSAVEADGFSDKTHQSGASREKSPIATSQPDTLPPQALTEVRLLKGASTLELTRGDEIELESFLRRRAQHRSRSAQAKLMKKKGNHHTPGKRSKSPARLLDPKGYNALMQRAASRSRSRPSSPVAAQVLST